MMHVDKLLTIVVPTYNRAPELRLLLNSLCSEPSEIRAHIDIIVGDNCSTDVTEKVTEGFSRSWPGATILRHERNLGPDENFCRCIELVRTRYFWIIGDDDVPKSGVLGKVVELLLQEAPDLVYLNSEWAEQISSNSEGVPVLRLKYDRMTQLDFARKVNVWTTFISGVIVNRSLFVTSPEMASLRRFTGSSLVQLGWVLGALKDGKRFIYVADPCILAKAGNTGGYAVVTVFGCKFSAIVNEVFGARDPIAGAMVRRNISGFLPHLVWALRFKNNRKFVDEPIWGTLRAALSGYPMFWLLLTPISLAPRPMAWVFLKSSRIVHRLICEYDRWRSKPLGRGCP